MGIDQLNRDSLEVFYQNIINSVSGNFWEITVVSLLAFIAVGGALSLNEQTEQTRIDEIESELASASTADQSLIQEINRTYQDQESSEEGRAKDLREQIDLLLSMNSTLNDISGKDFSSYSSYSSDGASKSDIDSLELSTAEKQDKIEEAIEANRNELERITEQNNISKGLLQEQVQDQAESETLFGEQITADRNVEIDLVSDQGTSVLRDVKITNGSASIPSMPASTGELMLKTGTTNDSRAALETANLGRYSPGASAQMGIGFRELEKPEGEQYWKAGLFDEEDGFFFGRDSECLYVASKSNGEISKKVCQENWNGQDVSETLGREWSPQDGTIMQIDYSWYGYGAIRFSLVETNEIDSAEPYNVQNTVAVHSFTPEGSTSISDPIQPIRIETYNGNSSEDYEVRVGGRQFSILGPTSKVTRISNDGVTQKTVTGSDFQCLAAFKKDSTDQSANTEAQFYGVQGLSSTDSVELGVFYNANLTSAGSFNQLQNTPDRESSLLSNRGCELANSTGENVEFADPAGMEIWDQIVSGSTGLFTASPGGSQVNGLNVKLPQNRNMVLAARTLDSGATTEVSANMRLIERK